MGSIQYRYLVVCPGIEIDWDHIAGLPETLGQNGVCSNEPASPLGLRPLDNRFHDSTLSWVDAEDPDVVALVFMEAGR